MPKKGHRLPVRVTYAYEGGPKGAEALYSLDEVDSLVLTFESGVRIHGRACTYTVTIANDDGTRRTVTTRTITTEEN